MNDYGCNSLTEDVVAFSASQMALTISLRRGENNFCCDNTR